MSTKDSFGKEKAKLSALVQISVEAKFYYTFFWCNFVSLRSHYKKIYYIRCQIQSSLSRFPRHTASKALSRRASKCVFIRGNSLSKQLLCIWSQSTIQASTTTMITTADKCMTKRLDSDPIRRGHHHDVEMNSILTRTHSGRRELLLHSWKFMLIYHVEMYKDVL